MDDDGVVDFYDATSHRSFLYKPLVDGTVLSSACLATKIYEYVNVYE